MSTCPSIHRSITRAFILCAGLGTRLRPMTDLLPKPLIPFFNTPLLYHTMQRCYDCGVREFIINTHHLADKFEHFFPNNQWNGCPVYISHEPVLLDSGGGLRQIKKWCDDKSPLLVMNGDMASTFDLQNLLNHHLSHRPLATLALRSSGDKLNVGFDKNRGLITDMRHALGISEGTTQFTGAYCVESSLFDIIPDGVVSIIPTFLQLIQQEQLHGVLCDDGLWADLGTPEAYLKAHELFPTSSPRISPKALIHSSAFIDAQCVIGDHAEIKSNCHLESCVVWPGVTVPEGTIAKNQIIFQ
ncbi:MAG: sugar phosphate nucleotidyltransferase [Akkermansia sp.]|nr:sugar phosphate nucleotidyltransferase [Akkermansia sp.]